MDALVALYARSMETGVLEVHIPDAPALETGTVAEHDLAGVAGGFSFPPQCCGCCCF